MRDGGVLVVVPENKVVQVLILGGEVDGRRLQSWLPSDEGSECGPFSVAKFLQSIEATRRALIPHDSPLHKSNALAESMPERPWVRRHRPNH